MPPSPPQLHQALDFEPLIREPASCFCWEGLRVWPVEAALQKGHRMVGVGTGMGMLAAKAQNCLLCAAPVLNAQLALIHSSPRHPVQAGAL